jgi:hypothetical protein
VSEYTDADLEEAFDQVNQYVDHYATQEERSAFVDALIAYDMYLRFGQYPAWFAVLEATDE